MINCPECGTAVEPTWDWCEACGFDPEGLKPQGWRPARAPVPPAPAVGPPPASRTAPPPNRRLPLLITLAVAVFVVIVIASIGGMSLIGRSPDSPENSATNAPFEPVSEVPWQTYRTADGVATIDFPGVPAPREPVLRVDGEVEQHTVMVDQNKTLYVFGYHDIAPDRAIADPASTLTSTVDALAAAAPLTNVSRNSSTYGGMPSVELTAQSGDGTQVRGVLILAGHRVYLIALYNAPGEPVSWLRFMSSWHLL